MGAGRSSTAKIAELGASDFAPGALLPLFKAGAVAVRISDDPRFQQAWDNLLPRMCDRHGTLTERLPWEAPLAEIARNHMAFGGLDCVGDVVHFSPGRIGYIGRKMEISVDRLNGEIHCEPSGFEQGGMRFAPDKDILSLCQDIADGIFAGFVKPGTEMPIHKVVLHRLKYEALHSDIENLCRLVESAAGRWSQLGYKLDRYRETARGPLAWPGVIDLYAICCLSPWLRNGLGRLNDRFAETDRKRKVAPGEKIIGKAHYDGRYFSALSGDRDRISTELFDGSDWHRVSLRPDQMLVIPGLMARCFGVQPTLHRVLHTDDGSQPGEHMNITLLLGVK